jgi:hypothetical protein
MHPYRYVLIALAVVCCTGSSAWSNPWPFWPTLLEEARQANAMVYGEFFNLPIPPTRPFAQFPELCESLLSIENM